VTHPSAAQPTIELDDRLTSTRAQAAAACARSGELQQWTTRVLTKAQDVRRTVAEARRQRRSSPAGQDLLQRSEHARLLARLESMPVIEQAKGIVMAQSHCGNAQAFDLLRRASQRSNVPVRELAAQIVAKTAQVPPNRVRQTSRGGEIALERSGLSRAGLWPRPARISLRWLLALARAEAVSANRSHRRSATVLAPENGQWRVVPGRSSAGSRGKALAVALTRARSPCRPHAREDGVLGRVRAA
jgi:hypothetical protein